MRLSICLVLIALTTAGCNCGAPVRATNPVLTVEPSALDFGPVTTGTTLALNVRVSNDSAVTVRALGAHVAADARSAFVLGLLPQELAAGESVELRVEYRAPPALGPDGATLIIESDATNREVSISLSGISVAGAISDGGSSDGGAPDAGPKAGPACTGFDAGFSWFSDNTTARQPRIISAGERFGVTWEQWPDGGPNSAEVHFALISEDGGYVPGSDVRVSPANAVTASVPQLGWSGTEFAVVYHDARVAPAQVYLTRLNSSGQLISAAEVRVSAEGGAQEWLASVAWNPVRSEWGVVWVREKAGEFTRDIRFARVDAAGQLVAGSQKTWVTSSTVFLTQAGRALAWTGSNFVVAYTDANQVWVEAFDGLGNAVSNSRTALVTRTQLQHASVATSGSVHASVWYSNGVIEMGLAHADGGTVTSSALQLSTPNANAGTLPSLFWNGANFVGVWTESNDGGTPYFTFAKVTPAGVIAQKRELFSEENHFPFYVDGAANGCFNLGVAGLGVGTVTDGRVIPFE